MKIKLCIIFTKGTAFDYRMHKRSRLGPDQVLKRKKSSAQIFLKFKRLNCYSRMDLTLSVLQVTGSSNGGCRGQRPCCLPTWVEHAKKECCYEQI